MNELQALARLDSTLARAVIRVYLRDGRDAALGFLSGFWYGTGVRRHAETQAVAEALGLTVGDLSS